MVKKRRMWHWMILLNVVTLPVACIQFMFELIGTGCEFVGDSLWKFQNWWLVKVRVMGGLTPDGETPEQIAEREARREKALAELRKGLPVEE